MDDFVSYLDEQYSVARKRENIPNKQKDFSIFYPAIIKMDTSVFNDFLIQKERMTIFLYTKNDCRVFFSDEDIIYMLLQVKKKEAIETLIEELKDAYNGIFPFPFYFIFNKITFSLSGIRPIDYCQELFNEQDVSCEFATLIALINIILAKDVLGTNMPMWSKAPSFIKHTCCKYITLLKFYYFGDKNAKEYLIKQGYNTDENILENYSTPQKREEKSGYFKNYSEFEKMLNIC